MDKVYNPKLVEEKWRALWTGLGIFRSSPKGNKENRFAVVIPPPNVTGALHIGHGLNNTLQDVLVRYHRLRGREACWVPGTDHGGIATQSVMEKILKGEKTSRQDLGRERFLERMQAWTRDCKKTILGQLSRLGCALDWDREAFTMDEVRARAVMHAFGLLWKKGWIYRGKRMVNWCVRCGTALSDIEVEFEERKGKLWHIHYPLKGGGRGIVVATTRPETMLGDTAVAVHPEDGRYKRLIGQTLVLPLMNREIPVVGDPSVDSEFGTGAVKVTPAHDPNDFEIGQRHGLDSVQVIGPDGKMTDEAGAYSGLGRDAAREKVLADLGNLLEKTEDYRHSVGVCYRCLQPIEPLVSEQWFVKVADLAQKAVEATQDGRVAIHPKSWERPYLEWLKNVKDWCISRQIWWGHRIPVWYCESSSCPPFFSGQQAQKCPGCASREIRQDPDVLDTWFSSALWPLSVFGWPEETEDLNFYYPTSVLVTGYEILYLWVARMVMMGLEFRGEAPFKDVYIHGIVRDKFGKKMSKSLGNVIDPLEMMDKYGTDSFRFSLISQAHHGKDIPFAEDSIVGARNFSNKIWNTARFVLMNMEGEEPPNLLSMEDLSQRPLELCDRWILSEYQNVLAQTQKCLERYDLANAADALYGFLWDKFCDWYVELAKIRLQKNGKPGDSQEIRVAQTILLQVFAGTLRMLNPFMPYITEDLYHHVSQFVLVEGWPSLKPDWADPKAEEEMAFLMEAIRAIRAIRSELQVPPSAQLEILICGEDRSLKELLQSHQSYVTRLAKLKELKLGTSLSHPSQSATAVVRGVTIYVPLSGIIDLEKERQRLEKELSRLDEELARLTGKLSNENFVQRAARSEVEKARRLKDEALQKQTHLKETLQALSQH